MQGFSKETQRRSADSYRFGGFELNPSQRTLHREGESILLQPKAFDTLLLLVANARRLVRKEELQDAIWPDVFVSDANLTNIIVTLRKILGREAIETVPKYGYRFKARIEGEPGVAGDVFALLVRAKGLIRARSIEATVEARGLLWLAIAQDPGFAEAWSWLGRCCRFLHKFGIDSASSLELAAVALERSLMIDPDLASAHHFYTQLEADTGKALQAMTRLLDRVSRYPHEAEAFVSLVQILRYCGLPAESIAAHRIAAALDPAVGAGVAHTYFVQGEYQAAIACYDVNPGYYLDAASWAALGQTDRAATLLRQRLAAPDLSKLMRGLMSSLLAALEDRFDEAARIMEATDVAHEPEVLFYTARHFGYIGMGQPALDRLERAFRAGYVSAATLASDEWLRCTRKEPSYRSLLAELRRAEDKASREFERSNGVRLLHPAGDKPAD